MKTMILLMAGALALAGCEASPEPAPAPDETGPVIVPDCDADPELCTYDDGKPK